MSSPFDEKTNGKKTKTEEKDLTMFNKIKSKTEAKDNGNFFSKVQADETKKGMDILFFGDSNTGKTYIAHTFPEPIFIIDTEGRAGKTTQYHFPKKDVRTFNPMEISTDFKTEGELEDAIDFETSVDNITNLIIAFYNKVKSGEIKQGTLVIDSLSDLWTWIQEWGKSRLAKKDKVDLLTSRLKSQFDWGLMTGRHYKLITAMRKLLDYNINIVGTARENKPPEYAGVTLTGVSNKIRAQKDVPFWFSSIVNLQIKNIRAGDTTDKKYLAIIEKLETLDYNGEPIENLTYDKLRKLIDKKRKEVSK